MPSQEKGKSNELHVPEEQSPELLVAALSIPPKSAARLKIEPLVPEHPDLSLEVAPLAFRRRRASNSSPALEERKDTVKPLTIRKHTGTPTRREPTSEESTSETLHTQTAAESNLLSLLSENTSFSPHTPPPSVVAFEEDPSPQVINRRLKTGHFITTTEYQHSEDLETSEPSFSSRVPGQDTGINPYLLRAPHTSGKAQDSSHRPIIGLPTINTPARQGWEESLAEDQGLRLSPLRTFKMMEEREEAAVTPPNTGVPGEVNPIQEDLTPSHDPSGSDDDQEDVEEPDVRPWRLAHETGVDPFPKDDPFLNPVPAEAGLEMERADPPPMTLGMEGEPPLVEDDETKAERNRIMLEQIRRRGGTVKTKAEREAQVRC
jgi:hypothetical protein